MNAEIEGIIVNAFIESRKKERMIFELNNPKKRFWSCWDIPRYIDKKYAVKITESIPTYEVIHKLLKKHGAPDQCYVMGTGPGQDLDGKEMPLADALKEVVYYGPVLVSCIHGKLAYLGEEQCIGAPDRYLLIRE